MNLSRSKKREEARRLFLAGEMTTNAEIAAHLGVKPHTVGRWRKEEDWDDLQRKIDRRAAEKFVEEIATERSSLNVRHYRYWELVLANLAEEMKAKKGWDVRELERVTGVLERAQKGQRLAKGMSVSGETEESLRAKAEAEVRRLVDRFLDLVKEYVPDEEARGRISQGILASLPPEAGLGDGDAEDEGDY